MDFVLGDFKLETTFRLNLSYKWAVLTSPNRQFMLLAVTTPISATDQETGFS